MSILVTGVAGFIGMHTAESLLSQGHHVVGIDNINNYYDPRLKEERLNQLKHFNNFSFMKLDFAVQSFSEKFINIYPDIDQVIHLGAQAGVRNSIKEPHDYMNSNLAGQLNILEYCRKLMERNNNFKKLIYAVPLQSMAQTPKSHFLCMTKPTIQSLFMEQRKRPAR